VLMRRLSADEGRGTGFDRRRSSGGEGTAQERIAVPLPVVACIDVLHRQKSIDSWAA